MILDKTAVVLDLRQDIRAHHEPFSRVMRALSSLGPGDSLRVILLFETSRLFQVASQYGFSVESKLRADGDWGLLFQRLSDRGAPGP